MKKEDYIRAIEELNKEQIEFYNSQEFKRYRNRKQIKELIKNKKFKNALQMMLQECWTKTRLFIRKIRHTIEKILAILVRIIKQEERKPKTREKTQKYQLNYTMEDLEQYTKAKKVVYTCVAGEYDYLYTPLITTENTKYVVFSNNKIVVKDAEHWELRPIPERVQKLCNSNKTLINRYIKMHPKEMFPEEDYALYVDGSLRIISDVTELFSKINPKSGLAFHKHPKREDVYEEAKACIKSGRGNKKKIKQQIKKYKKEGFIKKYGLFEATAIASDLHNENATKILDLWWEEFFKTGTYRDQIIFTYILWKNNYSIEDIGILGENVSKNPKFRRYSHRVL